MNSVGKELLHSPDNAERWNYALFQIELSAGRVYLKRDCVQHAGDYRRDEEVEGCNHWLI